MMYTNNRFTIQLKLDREKLLDQAGFTRLRDGYMRDDEVYAQERYAYVATEFADDIEHAERLYDYISKHWLSPSSPILSHGRTRGGLPISCYVPRLYDTANALLETSTEMRLLAMSGGGIGVSIGIRSADDKSTGVLPHLKTYDADTNAYRQNRTRRGSTAAWLDISHPDILMFIKMRDFSGGDPEYKTPNLHHGVNIPDSFMNIISECMKNPEADDSWPLIDHKGRVVNIVSAKALWETLLETRHRTGEPMIHFSDTSNNYLNNTMKLDGTIYSSNLCSEIFLPQSETRTPVCALASLNIVYWNEYNKNEQFFEDVLRFIDNAQQRFIDDTHDRQGFERARHSASKSRAVGIGQIGFHDYLQRKRIPFESAMAISVTRQVSARIFSALQQANVLLADERGNCEDKKGRRCSHLIAIAPNASTSILLGNTSPSVEPFNSNIYLQKTLSGTVTKYNQNMLDILQTYGKLDDDTLLDIKKHKGSVQHIEWMSQQDKDILKTAREIEQFWILEHAIHRQEFVDQGQSINLYVNADVDIKYLHELHYRAWTGKLKSLYYLRAERASYADDLAKKVERKIINVVNNEECLACQ